MNSHPIYGMLVKSKILESYKIAVEYPDVSGFETLELLDTRSKLSEIESQLTADDQATLARADEMLWDNLKTFYESVRAIGNLKELRERSKALPSHWWWYMDKFARINNNHS